MDQRSLCPHKEPIIVDGEAYSAREVLEVLTPQVTERRRERIDEVLSNRTYAVAPVLEGLYDRGNVSAVMRSAEAMGCQPFHIIETSKNFKKANRVTQGADKWIDVFTWESTADCVAHLREQGYRICVTCFEDATPIDDLAFDGPNAIVFGNEMEGVSQEMLAAADVRVVVPMLGFAQSYNISVAAALSLYHIRLDRLHRLGRHGDLTEKEREILTALFYLRSAASAKHVLHRTLES